MSDEVPETFGGAIRGFLYALGFVLLLIGVELIVEKSGDRVWSGGAFVVLSLPVFLSAVFWRWIRARSNIGIIARLQVIVGDPRSWSLLVIAFGYECFVNLQEGHYLRASFSGALGLAVLTAMILRWKQPKTLSSFPGPIAVEKGIPAITGAGSEIGNSTPESPPADRSREEIPKTIPKHLSEIDLPHVIIDLYSTHEHLHEEFNLGHANKNIPHKFVYLDPESVRTWKSVLNRRKYRVYEDCLEALRDLLESKEWQALIASTNIRCLVDLGVGAGEKNYEIIRKFVELNPERDVQFIIVDSSFHMIETTLRQMAPMLSEHHHKIEVTAIRADFMKLEPLKRHFYRSDGANAAYFVIGNTFANVPEDELLLSLQKVVRPGDVLILGIEYLSRVNADEELKAIKKQYEELRDLAAIPARKLRPEADLKTVHESMDVRIGYVGEYSRIPGTQAVVVFTKIPNGDQITIGYSNRYLEASLKSFLESYKFEYQFSIPSPRNRNYNEVVFKRVS